MFLVNLIRWLRGIVSFEVCGDFVERFLNLAAGGKINLFNIKKKCGMLYACCGAADVKELKVFAEKTGCEIKIVSEKGFPSLIKRYKKRLGILIGAAAFIAVIMVFPNFIWAVEVSGNETVASEEILNILSEIGVKTGAFIPSLNINILEEKLLVSTDKLSWAAINIKGSTALVEVKERDFPPEMKTDDSPCNIIAAKSGVIRKIEVYEGQAVVSEGEGISEGHLLISGIIETKKGNTYIKHANGIVLAEVEYSYNIEIPYNEVVKQPTGKIKKRYYINFLNFKMPLWFYDKKGQYEIEQSEDVLKIMGNSFPISFISQTCTEVRDVEIKLSETEAKEKAKSILNEKINIELKEKEIVNRSVTGSGEGTKYVINAVFAVLEDICKQEKILVKDI